MPHCRMNTNRELMGASIRTARTYSEIRVIHARLKQQKKNRNRKRKRRNKEEVERPSTKDIKNGWKRWIVYEVYPLSTGGDVQRL